MEPPAHNVNKYSRVCALYLVEPLAGSLNGSVYSLEKDPLLWMHRNGLSHLCLDKLCVKMAKASLYAVGILDVSGPMVGAVCVIEAIHIESV